MNDQTRATLRDLAGKMDKGLGWLYTHMAAMPMPLREIVTLIVVAGLMAAGHLL